MKDQLAMRGGTPSDAPLTDEELAAYAVPDEAPAAPAPAPGLAPLPTEQPAVAAADAPLTQEELDSYYVGQPDSAKDPIETPAPEAPRRVNMVADQDGSLVDVAPQDVERAYGLGYRLDPSEVASDKTATVIEPTGNVTTVDAAALPDALSKGARIATPSEIQTEYSDFGSKAATAAEGVLQGASLGAYGFVADKLAGQDYRAEREIREQENPKTAIGSTVVGAIAPALLSGGTSSGATGASLAARAAALTPAARLAGFGARMAESLGVQATKQGLGALGRIGASAVVAAGEGAIDNAARRVADDLGAGDVDGVAERMVDAAWDGAKYSAIFGAGAQALGEAGSAVAGRLRARSEGKRAAKAAAAEAERIAAAEAMPSVDVPPPEAVRPRADIDADLDDARKALDDADLSGDKTVAQGLEEKVSQLVQEQEAAAMASENLTPDAAIANALNVEPPPEALGILDRIDRNLNTVKNAREIKTHLKDAADQLSESITTDLDNLSRLDTNTVQTYTNRSNKPKVIRNALVQDGVEQWSQEAAGKVLGRVQRMESVLDDMMDIKRHAIYSRAQLGSFKAGKEAISKLREHLTEMHGAGPIAPGSRIMRGGVDDVAEVYHGLDLFKSHLGSFAAQMGGRPASTSEATFQRLYMLLRADLQDASLFGPSIAEMQTATNAAITRDITKSRLFQALFGRAGSSEKGGQFGFGDVLEHDPKKVGSMLDNLADPRTYKDTRDFFAGLTSRVERMETLAKYYPMPDPVKAQIANARTVLNDITAKVRATKELALKAAEAERLAAQTNNVQEILTGIRALPMGGGVASVANAATAVTRGLAASIVALGKGAAKQEQTVAKAARATVKNLIEEAPETAKKVESTVARATAKASEDVPAHLVGIGMTVSALRHAIDDARALQDPSSKEFHGLQAQLEDIAQESPELAQAVEAKVRAKADFIASKAGPALDTSDPFRPKPKLVDPMTERAVARYVDAARNPGNAFHRLATGTATREDKETLKALYPSMFTRYTDAVLAHVKESKTPPNHSQRQKLFFATGVPMSREQDPAYVRRRQQEKQKQPAEKQKAESIQPMVPPSKAKTEFNADKHFASRSDAIMGSADD